MLVKKMRPIPNLMRPVFSKYWKYLLGGLGVLIIFLLSFSSILLYLEPADMDLEMRFGEEVCMGGVFLFPYQYKIDDTVFAYEFKENAVIFDRFSVFAKQLCFEDKTLVQGGEKHTVPIFFMIDWLFAKEIKIDIEEFSVLEDSYADHLEPLQILSELELFLDKEDRGFEYKLEIGGTELACKKSVLAVNDLGEPELAEIDNGESGGDLSEQTSNKTKLTCDIYEYNLEQEREYEISLNRYYDGEFVESLFNEKVWTNEALEIVRFSFKDGEEFLNPSQLLTFETNKVVTDLSVGVIKIQRKDENTWSDLEVNVVFNEKSIEVLSGEPLQFGGTYQLLVQDLVSGDGSVLNKQYERGFTVSVGPKVTSSDFENEIVLSNKNLILYFNQPLKTGQNIGSFISLNSGSAYSYTIKDNYVVINPKSNLGWCKNFTIKVKTGLQNIYGAPGVVSKELGFRTTCVTTKRLGRSVEGRAIMAKYVGSGSRSVLFFGAIHGNEASTVNLMNALVSDLDVSYNQIPSNTTVIVVPNLNPDGVSAGTRVNANDVDLNRNFDTANWQEETYSLNHTYPKGGGESPFSEPEAQILRDLILSEHPDVSIAYHSAAGMVIPNGLSGVAQMGRDYSNKSGYRLVTESGGFEYEITGAFNSWMYEGGRNSIVVELYSHYNTEFSLNKNAMWDVIK